MRQAWACREALGIWLCVRAPSQVGEKAEGGGALESDPLFILVVGSPPSSPACGVRGREECEAWESCPHRTRLCPKAPSSPSGWLSSLCQQSRPSQSSVCQAGSCDVHEVFHLRRMKCTNVCYARKHAGQRLQSGEWKNPRRCPGRELSDGGNPGKHLVKNRRTRRPTAFLGARTGGACVLEHTANFRAQSRETPFSSWGLGTEGHP